MVDLNELIRLHKVAQGSTNMGDTAAFIFAISHACDDGLLERLRHAEMQRPYTYVGRDGKAIKARDLEDQRDDAIARAETAEMKLAEADSLVFLTTMRAEAAEAHVATALETTND